MYICACVYYSIHTYVYTVESVAGDDSCSDTFLIYIIYVYYEQGLGPDENIGSIPVSVY